MAISSLSSLGVLRASREVTTTNSFAMKAKLLAANQNPDGIVGSSRLALSALQNVYTNKGAYKITPIKAPPASEPVVTPGIRPDTGLPAAELSFAPKSPAATTSPVLNRDEVAIVKSPRIGGPIGTIALEDTVDIGPISYSQPGAPTPATPEDNTLSLNTLVSGKFKPIAKLPEGGERTPVQPIKVGPGQGPGILPDTSLPPRTPPVYESGADDSVVDIRDPKQPIKVGPGQQPDVTSKLDAFAELRRPRQPIKVPPIAQPVPVQADVDPAEQPISLYPFNELA